MVLQSPVKPCFDASEARRLVQLFHLLEDIGIGTVDLSIEELPLAENQVTAAHSKYTDATRLARYT